MRAEGQANIDRIEAALALVRQSLDWDVALRRLAELNARVQDPTLWDNPKEAQAVSREQKTLETAVNTVNEISAEMADAIEFIEMGEAEGEEDIVNDGLATLEKLADRADADKVQALLSGEADPITPPAYADLAAVNLGNARHLIGRKQGHGQAGRGCMPDIIGDFVAAASIEDLETGCIDRFFAMPFFLDFSGPSP